MPWLVKVGASFFIGFWYGKVPGRLGRILEKCREIGREGGKNDKYASVEVSERKFLELNWSENGAGKCRVEGEWKWYNSWNEVAKGADEKAKKGPKKNKKRFFEKK